MSTQVRMLNRPAIQDGVQGGGPDAGLHRVRDAGTITRPRMPRRLLPASLLGVLAILVGGVAFASWGGSGSGAGSATTGTTVPMTVSPAAADATLFPGGQADVALTLSNPNASEVRIGSIALDPDQGAGGFAVDPGHPGCLVSALSFTTQTNGGAGWTVPASGSLPVVLTSALGMGLGAANACQGATFTVYVAAGP